MYISIVNSTQRIFIIFVYATGRLNFGKIPIIRVKIRGQLIAIVAFNFFHWTIVLILHMSHRRHTFRQKLIFEKIKITKIILSHMVR